MRLAANDSYYQATGDLSLYRDLGVDTITVMAFQHLHSIESVMYRAEVITDAGFDVVIHPGAYGKFDSPKHAQRRLAQLNTAIGVVIAEGCMDTPLLDAVNEPVSYPLPYLERLLDEVTHSDIRLNEQPGVLTGELTQTFATLVSDLQEWIAAVGLQAHVSVPEAQIPPWQQLEANYRCVQNCGPSGLQMHISELSCPSDRMGWTEETQAQWLYDAICQFRDWGADLVGLWDLHDAHAWNATSGLLRPDGTRKPAWDAVKAAMAGDPWPAPAPTPAPTPWWHRLLWWLR